MTNDPQFWCWAGNKEPKRITVIALTDADLDLKAIAAAQYADQEHLNSGQWVEVVPCDESTRHRVIMNWEASPV